MWGKLILKWIHLTDDCKRCEIQKIKKKTFYEKKYENIKHEGNIFVNEKLKFRIYCVYDHDRDRDREQKFEVDLIIGEFSNLHVVISREWSWNFVVCAYDQGVHTQYVKYTQYIYIN